MSITERIDNITGIPPDYLHASIPPPESCKIELTANCNYKCLRGDTLVDTIYGRIPIKELSEKYDTVPVFTYKEGKVFISDAINIKKTGDMQKLVRVLFDDGTHIDCTPDHKFMQFKAGRNGSIEWPTEAMDLIPGSRVRAYRENIVGGGYVNICWGREFRQKRYRMIMEYLIGRKLTSREHVHHSDGNTANDLPDNLEYYSSAKEHFAKHPEIAERMRNDNPAFNMTDEWREKIAKSITGKMRSLAQRLNYRKSKLGEKNPNFINGDSSGRSRIAEINHKIVSITPLGEMDDVYCLEVPETGWFFANQVLVKNCTFCVKSIMPDNSQMDRAFYSRIIREMYDAGVKELGMFYIGESFTCKWLPEAIKEAKDVGFPYVFLTTNGSAATPERVKACMEAGLDSLKFSVNFTDADQFKKIAQVNPRLYEHALKNIANARKVKDEGGYKCGIYASSIKFDGEQGEKMQKIIDEHVTPYVDEFYWLPLYGMSGASKKAGWKPQPGNPGRLDNMRPSIPCWAAFTEAHITAKGKLAACCFGTGADNDLVMADLNQVSFTEGWNSATFQALRQAHLNKDLRGTGCESCVSGC